MEKVLIAKSGITKSIDLKKLTMWERRGYKKAVKPKSSTK